MELNEKQIKYSKTPTEAYEDVKSFSMDAMLSILRVQKEKEAKNNVKNNTKKHLFESESKEEVF